MYASPNAREVLVTSSFMGIILWQFTVNRGLPSPIRYSFPDAFTRNGYSSNFFKNCIIMFSSSIFLPPCCRVFAFKAVLYGFLHVAAKLPYSSIFNIF